MQTLFSIFLSLLLISVCVYMVRLMTSSDPIQFKKELGDKLSKKDALREAWDRLWHRK